jgi:hypothetical protein
MTFSTNVCKAKMFGLANISTTFFFNQLLPDRRGGRPESSLSPLTRRGGPPPPGPREGGFTSLFFWSIAGSTVASLLRGAGGFNHPKESLNPSLHTGGPRRGRSFRRLRRWRQCHGSQSMEMTSYVYVIASEFVTARLRRHEEALATPRRSGYSDTSSFGFFTAWDWSLQLTRLTLDPDVPPATSTCTFI